jgi:hypothetical protein
VCAFILLFCGCWHAPLSGTSGDLPPLVFLLGPRVWGYGAPVGALPSMGRSVFGLVWQILIMCGEAFLGVGSFLAAPSYPGSRYQPLQPFVVKPPSKSLLCRFCCGLLLQWSCKGLSFYHSHGPTTLSILLLLLSWGPLRRSRLIAL